MMLRNPSVRPTRNDVSFGVPFIDQRHGSEAPLMNHDDVSFLDDSASPRLRHEQTGLRLALFE